MKDFREAFLQPRITNLDLKSIFDRKVLRTTVETVQIHLKRLPVLESSVTEIFYSGQPSDIDYSTTEEVRGKQHLNMRKTIFSA